MPTLYVENVPDDLYEALRSRAQENRTSISAEVLALLARNIPTQAELARRKEFIKRAAKLRSRRSTSPGPFPPAEEMQRQDRAR
jgi:plasmid stability protein